MKTLTILCILLYTATAIYAQDTEKKQSNKEKKEIRKKQKEALEAEMAKSIKLSIDSQQWVLEAYSLADKRGATIQVPSNLNFVAMNGSEVFIQIGSNAGLGANGVGGVSLSTTASRYEVKQNPKNGSYFIKLYTTSTAGSFTIMMDCDSTGQTVSASVQGNTSQKVQYRGQLVPLKQSTVYKGRAIY
jgi:hypothetical protein